MDGVGLLITDLSVVSSGNGFAAKIYDSFLCEISMGMFLMLSMKKMNSLMCAKLFAYLIFMVWCACSLVKWLMMWVTVTRIWVSQNLCNHAPELTRAPLPAFIACLSCFLQPLGI